MSCVILDALLYTNTHKTNTFPSRPTFTCVTPGRTQISHSVCCFYNKYIVDTLLYTYMNTYRQSFAFQWPSFCVPTSCFSYPRLSRIRTLVCPDNHYVSAFCSVSVSLQKQLPFVVE